MKVNKAGLAYLDLKDKNGLDILEDATILYKGDKRKIIFEAGRFRLSPEKYGESLTDSDNIEVICSPRLD